MTAACPGRSLRDRLPYLLAGLMTLTMCVVLVCGTVYKLLDTPPPPKPPIDHVAVGGPFELVDQDGRTVTERDFRGRLLLVYFGYTWCSDICPMELGELSDVLDSLGERASEVTLLFISVDPGRDTPRVLKEYVANFHPQLRGLTGSREQVERAVRAYRAHYKSDDPLPGVDYNIDHSASVYLMDRDGRYLATFHYGAPPELIAGTLRDHL